MDFIMTAIQYCFSSNPHALAQPRVLSDMDRQTKSGQLLRKITPQECVEGTNIWYEGGGELYEGVIQPPDNTPVVDDRKVYILVLPKAEGYVHFSKIWVAEWLNNLSVDAQENNTSREQI